MTEVAPASAPLASRRAAAVASAGVCRAVAVSCGAGWAAAGWRVLRGGREWTRHLLPVVWILVYYAWQGGGWVMSMVDIAGAIPATRRARSRVSSRSRPQTARTWAAGAA